MEATYPTTLLLTSPGGSPGSAAYIGGLSVFEESGYNMGGYRSKEELGGVKGY